MTAIILTGCDPAKKTPAGPQSKGGGGSLGGGGENKDSFSYPNSDHSFFSFRKDMKALDRDVWACVLTDDEVSELQDLKTKRYQKIPLNLIIEDFVPLTNVLITEALLHDYLQKIEDKEAQKVVLSKLKKDYLSSHEITCFNNDNMIQRYRKVLKLVTLPVNSKERRMYNDSIDDMYSYVKSVEKYLDLIIIPKAVSNFLYVIDQEFRLVDTDGIQSVQNKLINSYGLKWLENEYSKQEKVNDFYNFMDKKNSMEKDFEDSRKEYDKASQSYEKEKEENKNFEANERDYDEAMKKRAQEKEKETFEYNKRELEKARKRNNSSFLFKSK